MSFVPVAVPDLVEEHATEASFAWTTRDQATRSPLYDLDDLATLDERLFAHLDGMRIAGDVGWGIALEQLTSEIEPGDAFVAAKIALDRADMRGFAQVLDQVEAEPALTRALPSAIGFCRFEAVERVLQAMIAEAVPPQLKAMGIAGFTVHRRDPGPALRHALVDGDSAVRTRALRAVGELALGAQLDDVVRATVADDPSERFWAGRSAALLGDPAGVATLEAIAEEPLAPYAARAARLTACLRAPESVAAWVERLDVPGRRAIALSAAEASGQPALLPWIVDCMDDVENARYAGQAFFTLTGVAIDGALENEPPAGAAEDEPHDDDEIEAPDARDDLPWPNRDAATRLLAGGSMPKGARVLLGHPIDRPWLATVLRTAPQPQREIAAWLRRASAAEMAFAVHAPAWQQRAALAALS